MRHFLSRFILAVLTTSLLPVAAIARDVWSEDSGTLPLNLSVAKFIKPEKPANAVFLCDPGIVGPDLQSARSLYIVGRKVGSANLFVLGEHYEEIVSATISFGVDAEMLSTAAQHAATGGQVSVSTLGSAVFLNCKVRPESDAATAGGLVAAILVVSLPTDGNGRVSARRRQELRDLLAVFPARLHFVDDQGIPGSSPTSKRRIIRLVCAVSSTSGSGLKSREICCADARNLAAVVANPEDVVFPKRGSDYVPATGETSAPAAISGVRP